MKKKLLIALLVVLAVLLGFLRDHVFVSINQFIESGSDPDGNYLVIKWVLTLLFTVLYFLISCVLLFSLFGEKKIIWLAVFSYILLIAFAFVAAVAGFFLSSFAQVYPYIRTIMGVAQSPIVLMVLIAVGYLGKKASRRAI